MKCVKCGKHTKFALRFDIDLPPIYAHKKCENDVKTAFLMLQMNPRLAEDFTKKWHMPFKL